MKITMEHKKTLSDFLIFDNGEIFSGDLFEKDKRFMDRRTKRILNLVNEGYLQAKKEYNKNRVYIRIDLTDKGKKVVCK